MEAQTHHPRSPMKVPSAEVHTASLQPLNAYVKNHEYARRACETKGWFSADDLLASAGSRVRVSQGRVPQQLRGASYPVVRLCMRGGRSHFGKDGVLGKDRKKDSCVTAGYYARYMAIATQITEEYLTSAEPFTCKLPTLIPSPLRFCTCNSRKSSPHSRVYHFPKRSSKPQDLLKRVDTRLNC